MSTEKQITFDGSSSIDISYFLFFFEQAAENGSTSEERAHSFIVYLQGHAFNFYYRQFSENNEIFDEAKSFKIVKVAFREEFRVKQDPKKAIERELSMNLRPSQCAAEFATSAEKAYSEAGFTMEQRFLFLSKQS